MRQRCRARAQRRSAGLSGKAGVRAHEGRAAMKIDGACHCGYITIAGEADPEKTTICHCSDCQTGTGSAFRVSVPVSGSTLRISGEPTTISRRQRTAESRARRPSVRVAVRRFIQRRQGRASRPPTWCGWASCASARSSCRGVKSGSVRRSSGDRDCAHCAK